MTKALWLLAISLLAPTLALADTDANVPIFLGRSDTPFELRTFYSMQSYTFQMQNTKQVSSYSLIGGGVEGVYYLSHDIAFATHYKGNLHTSTGAVVFSNFTSGLSYDIFGRSFLRAENDHSKVLISPRYFLRAFAGAGRWHFDFNSFASSNNTYLPQKTTLEGDFWAYSGGLSLDWLLSDNRRIGISGLYHQSISTPEKFKFTMMDLWLSTAWLL
jgi:hypothetical protein